MEKVNLPSNLKPNTPVSITAYANSAWFQAATISGVNDSSPWVGVGASELIGSATVKGSPNQEFNVTIQHYRPDDSGGGQWQESETAPGAVSANNVILVLSEDGGGGHPDDPNSSADWQDCVVYFTWQDIEGLHRLSLEVSGKQDKPKSKGR